MVVKDNPPKNMGMNSDEKKGIHSYSCGHLRTSSHGSVSLFSHVEKFRLPQDPLNVELRHQAPVSTAFR